MKKLRTTILALFAALMICLPVSVFAQSKTVDVIEEYRKTSSTTWNPGAVSATYYGEAYFEEGIYSRGGRIVITNTVGQVSVTHGSPISYGNYVYVRAYLYAPNNSYTAGKNVYYY